MTLLGQSQGKGCALTESGVPALKVHTPVLNCGDTRAARGQADAARYGGPDSWPLAGGRVPSIFDDCPLCGKPPIEPVFCDGQMACRTCTGACTICGAACIPGDDACGECALHLIRDRWAVLI